MIRVYDDNGNVIDAVEWKKQIRKKAIEECLEIVKFYKNEWDGIYWAIDYIEELKEREE